MSERPDTTSTTGWQPIKTAPKDGTVIDLFGADYLGRPRRWPDCRWIIDWLDEEEDGHWEQQYAEIQDSFVRVSERSVLTHWMPVPALPAFESTK